MTEKQVSRYIDLVHRRTYILTHSGVDWKPEYASETGTDPLRTGNITSAGGTTQK